MKLNKSAHETEAVGTGSDLALAPIVGAGAMLVPMGKCSVPVLSFK